MSLRTHHVAGNLECISLAATAQTPWRGLPKPFPLSATWAVYIDSSAPNDYMTMFSYGPNPFSSTNYYQAAIRASSGTGAADASWNLGFEGDHPPSGFTLISRGRWFYQGIRFKKDPASANKVVLEFYFDLPDLTQKLDVSDLVGDYSGTFLTPGSSHSLHIGENNWPATANNEAMEGEFQGVKIWQAFLDQRSLIAEAFSIWPVVPRYYNALWDIVPLISKYDKRRNNIKRTNNSQWTFPNVEPSTGNRRAPLQRIQGSWWLPSDILYSPATAATISTLAAIGVG